MYDKHLWPRNEYIYGYSFDVLGRVLEVLAGKSLDKAGAEALERATNARLFMVK